MNQLLFRHPLTEFVIDTFGQNCFDRVSLATALYGGTHIRYDRKTDLRPSEKKTYYTIADEIIMCMEHTHMITKDAFGYYNINSEHIPKTDTLPLEQPVF